MPPKKKRRTGGLIGGFAPQSVASHNVRGFLVSTQVGCERAAFAEARALLEGYCQQLHGEKEEEKEDKKDDDIALALKAEIDALHPPKGKKKQKHSFDCVSTGVGGLILLRSLEPDSLDPVSLASLLFEDSIKQGRATRPRWIQRIIPVETTCGAAATTIQQVAGPLVAPHLSQESPVSRWGVEWERRNNDKIDRIDAVNAVARNIAVDRHPVDLSDPQVLVVLQVFCGACAICVTRDYHRFRRYNLQTACESGVREPRGKKKDVDS